MSLGKPHWGRCLNEIMSRRLAVYAVLTVVVGLINFPLFGGDFVSDDEVLIKENRYITETQRIGSYLSQEDGIVDPEDKTTFHTGYYRPLLNITYHLDYRLWGMQAAGFRATNVLLHLLTCLVLYEGLRRCFGFKEGAFWAVLLFAVHPAQTEAVAIIVSRNNLLVTFFSLVSFFSYVVWWKKRLPLALAVSLLSFALSLFSKEFALVQVPLLFLYHRFLGHEKAAARREIISYLPFAVIVLIYVALRQTVVGSYWQIPPDLFKRLLFVPYLILYNFKIVFFPYELHSFYVRYPASVSAPEVLFPFLFLIILSLLLFFKRKKRLLLFGVVSFLVGLVPVLNLVSKNSVSLIAMRWLYFPLSYLALALAALLEFTGEDKRLVVKRSIISLIALFFAFLSYTLNAYLWKDQKTFLKQEAEHFRNCLYVGDYAEILLKGKKYGEAEAYFSQALACPIVWSRLYINYGALLIETGRGSEALNILESAKDRPMINKERVSWHNNLGAACLLLKRYDCAREHFLAGLSLDRGNKIIHRNMAYLMSQMGDKEGALRHLSIAEGNQTAEITGVKAAHGGGSPGRRGGWQSLR